MLDSGTSVAVTRRPVDWLYSLIVNIGQVFFTKEEKNLDYIDGQRKHCYRATQLYI